MGVARLASGSQVETPARHTVGKYPGKHVLAVAKLLPDRVGEILVLAHRHLEQLLGMADRQRLEKQRIDQAEDGRVSPDSQRQREDRHGGESGSGAQGAHRIANVPHNSVEHSSSMSFQESM